MRWFAWLVFENAYTWFFKTSSRRAGIQNEIKINGGVYLPHFLMKFMTFKGGSEKYVFISEMIIKVKDKSRNKRYDQWSVM